ncbi:hypothetical protein ACFWFF_34520, partial [Streptomyces sp. NPDC060223]
ANFPSQHAASTFAKTLSVTVAKYGLDGIDFDGTVRSTATKHAVSSPQAGCRRARSATPTPSCASST